MSRPSPARIEELKEEAMNTIRASNVQGMTQQEKVFYLAYLTNASLMCLSAITGPSYVQTFLKQAELQLQKPLPFVSDPSN